MDLRMIGTRSRMTPYLHIEISQEGYQKTGVENCLQPGTPGLHDLILYQEPQREPIPFQLD